tara:strand:+ start:903 stop:1169 length:267 start_codon:yes stop_codon:yes gene_type:complete
MIEQLPSFEETKKTMLKNNSEIPTRIRIGDIFYFDSNHWARRKEKNTYVGTYINIVGGKMPASATTLKDIIRAVVTGNEEMIALGRVR